MKTPNNNQSVISELAKAYDRQNRRQNRILITAIAMAVFLMYAAFSIAWGKIHADYLIDVRGMGTLATVSLENGSEAQYDQMKKLSYIEETGVKKKAGTGLYKEYWEGNLVYLDSNAYEKMTVPAYTNITGDYPQKDKEIMLSISSLRQMHIDRPETGMKIDLEVILPDQTKETISFSLCGYYTDYIDSSVTEPEAYISRDFLEKREISVFPADKIMAAAKLSEEGESIEARLYSDLIMEYDAQQVFAENPMVKQSVEGVFGSISIAVGCGLAVVICAFLLIFNVVSITMGRQIRQYGMLKVIGTTGEQLGKIVRRQNIKIIMKGIVPGAVLGSAVVKIFLPTVLENLFMHGLGESDVTGFYPQFLCGAVLLISAVSFFAAGMAARRVIKQNAIESVRYAETDNSCDRKRSFMVRALLPEMAWRNVTRSKKRLVVSILSLTVGCITAMGASVIVTGTDITNQLEGNPDFQVGILAGISRFPEMVPGQVNDDTPVLSGDMISAMSDLEGIDKKSMRITSGSYALIDFRNDTALGARKKSLDDPQRGVDFATIQIVDNVFVSELEQYVDQFGVTADIESLKAGNGCILLHYDELSQELEKQAAEALGEPIRFYSLDAYGSDENIFSSYEKGSLACAGYLDMTEKYFPELQTTTLGNNTNYFIMTERAFDRLGFSKKIFDISFDADKDYDKTLLDQRLSQLVQSENRKAVVMDMYYLRANYVLLETEQNRIDTANVILGGLSAIILVIGIMNYANMLFASLAVRRKEFAIMQSLGLTRGQLWKLIFFEGMSCWLLVMLFTGTAGSGVIWSLGMAIRQKLLYFEFVYPWQTMLMLALTLFVICILAAWIFCFRSGDMAEELRKGN